MTDGNGVPLANASVAIVPSGGSSAIATLTTNSGGQYTFSSVPLGSYVVRGGETGYIGATSATFTVGAGNNSAPTLALTKIVYASITGTIIDTNGNPVPNARVYAVSTPTSSTSVASVTTNASGQYTIPSLPIGTYAIHAYAAGYREGATPPFTVNQGANTAPTLQLAIAGIVAGTVTDGNGVPLANASVAIVPSAAGASAIATITTNSSGQYTFSSVPPGTYMVRGGETGYVSATSAAFTVSGGNNGAPTLALTRIVYGSLTGTIIDTNGNPVPNARVYAVPVPLNTALVVAVSTNASGQYTIPSLPVGTWTIHAAAPGYREGTTASFTVSQGVTRLRRFSLLLLGS